MQKNHLKSPILLGFFAKKKSPKLVALINKKKHLKRRALIIVSFSFLYKSKKPEETIVIKRTYAGALPQKDKSIKIAHNILSTKKGSLKN